MDPAISHWLMDHFIEIIDSSSILQIFSSVYQNVSYLDLFQQMNEKNI